MPAAKTALVVIDVQRGILEIPNLVRKKEIDQALDETVGRIAGLIARARTARVPVIYIQHDGSPGHRLEPGTSGWPLRPEISPQPGDPVSTNALATRSSRQLSMPRSRPLVFN